MPRVLVIDEDRAVSHAIRQAFVRTGIQINTARSVGRALALARQRRPDLFVVDASLIDDPLRVLLTGTTPERPPLVALSAHASPRALIEAMKLPAVDVLPKPVDYPRLREIVMRVLLMPASGNIDADAPLAEASFVAGCAAMHDIVLKVSRAASRDVTVLLTGEAGTGKSHLARVVHRHGPRAGGAFVEFDPTGKPADRLQRELFGQETVGQRDGRRLGWLERCQGGTLLVDEVDALPPQVQGRLLSVCEERSFRRVGGVTEIPVDIRLFASARHDVEGLVATGRFRADLYHDLHDFSIALPPLRERLDDLPQLAQWFLRRMAQPPGTRRVTAITDDAVDVLRAHRWPGNLWELESVLKQAARKCPGDAISPEDLPEPLRPSRPATATGVELPLPDMETLDAYLLTALKTDTRKLYPDCVALFDRYICRRVLTHTRGNQSRAARILGMTRRSLRTKVHRLDAPLT